MLWDEGLAGPYLDIAAYQGSPLRVMAGPGTGKSFALRRRVARLLESGILPSSILAVTFTRTAANDLVHQLQTLGVPGADRVRACTLHSLCFALLSSNAVFRATNRVARPLIGFEVDCLTTDLAVDFGGKRAAKELLKAFGAYWATLQHQQPGWPQDPVQQGFHRELLHWLTYHKAMLVDELVPRALEFILQNPASPELTPYAHVLADEYQDLNRADQCLIDALARQGTLAVIGDEDQSIYTALRHARPEGIVQFHQTHPNTHDVPLHDCIRCPTRVVHMANSLILHNHPQRPSTIRPIASNGPGEVCIVQHTSTQDEITSIAAFVDWYLANHPGVKPAEVLVLSTRRRIGYAIRDELVRLGRAAQSFFTEECLERQPAREGYCLLALLANHEDRPALRTWLGLGPSNWRTAAYQRIWQIAEANGVSPWELLDRITSGSVEPPPHTRDLVQRFSDLSTRLTALAGMTGPGLVDMLWPPGDQDCADMRGIALTVATSTQAPRQILDELVTTITQPELPSQRDDVIRVMSLHKSKGLTAKCIVVVGCIAGALPTIGTGLSSADALQTIEEQRRLFYVAITRTTETLVLSSAATAPYGDAMQMGLVAARRLGGNAILQASLFMSELGIEAPAAVSGNQWRTNSGF